MKLIQIKHTEKGWMYGGHRKYTVTGLVRFSKRFKLLYAGSVYAHYKVPYRDSDIPTLLGALAFTLIKQDKFL